MNKPKIFPYAVLSLATVGMFFPYIWMFLLSMKEKSEIYSGAFLPKAFDLSNLSRVFLETPMLTYLFNSVRVSFLVIIIQMLSAILAAYVMAAMDKKWVKILFLIILAMYMVPAAVTYIPSYIIISDLNLMDTHTGYILSEAISIFSIFFLRQAFIQVPKDVVNAARMDGAGHLRLIFDIYVPYCKNALASLVLITFIYSYNNYMWPSLLIKTPEKMFVTLGLRRLFMTQAGYGMDLPLAMSACAVSLLPVFLLLFIGNKRIIKSMASLYVNK